VAPSRRHRAALVSRTSVLERSHAPGMQSIFRASKAVMVAALIMLRPATIQARSTPKRLRRRVITGSRVVIPGPSPRAGIGGIAGPQEGGDGPVPLVQHDARDHMGELRSEVLGMAVLARRGATVAPGIQ
jgi:hypothetical protein